MESTIRNVPGLGLTSLLSVMAGVYTIQSLIGMFTLQGLPAVLRSEGVSTSQIGLFYIAMLPWALKFLWSPYIESLRKQGRTLKNHGYLILFAQVMMLVVLGILALTSALHQLTLIFACVLVLALLSTFADISTDGLAVDQLLKSQRRVGNVMQVGGAYLGAIFGGGMFIYLTGTMNWQIAIFVLIGLVVIMSLPTFKLFSKNTTQSGVSDGHIPSLKSAFLNPKIRQGLLLIALCQLGTRGVLSMMMPFLYDRGINLENLGLLTAGGGAITGFIGIAFSGWIIKHISAIKMVTYCLLAEMIVYTGFFFYSSELIHLPYGLEVLFVINAFIFAAKFVALYTLMMEWSYGKQAGVDFSFFQSMDMIVAIVMAILCGWIIANFGYKVHYTMAIIATFLAAFTLHQSTRTHDQRSFNISIFSAQEKNK
ncbi:MFS transporter [Shewanella sp. YLB-07]|uniref:MFS transporter n=1 Tax=Shewanella sp. YLB-07 TaxID=2601268 RepID=UPI00128E7D68|nr:MFS transporter [Shewanella sp. YLB-07]MPY21555.1 MFS transporter [Shewanella sp. YLB-07]